MENKDVEINDINDKLLELYGKLIKIKYHLDTLDTNNVEAKPVDKVDTRESVKQGQIQVGQRPNK
jgi:hypothetical protein